MLPKMNKTRNEVYYSKGTCCKYSLFQTKLKLNALAKAINVKLPINFYHKRRTTANGPVVLRIKRNDDASGCQVTLVTQVRGPLHK